MKNFLRRQQESRDDLYRAVRKYVALRAADGTFTTVVRTTNRTGEKVAVIVRLDILPDEQ